MFDMSKHKWFIAAADLEEVFAVQEWLLSKGYSWSHLPACTVRTDINDWEFPYAIGMGHFSGDCLGQASVGYWQNAGHHEVKVTFKKIVADCEYPVVESEQEKQIKALEETIQKAQEQIQNLKKSM